MRRIAKGMERLLEGTSGCFGMEFVMRHKTKPSRPSCMLHNRQDEGKLDIESV
jgi:hypothetical protein